MASQNVFLVSLNPEEASQIRQLFKYATEERGLGIEPEVELVELRSLTEALTLAAQEDPFLVVVRVTKADKRYERDIRRLKRTFSRPVPLLLLVPPEYSREVKDYLRAGADEYWILPMDSVTFPSRFTVLLELARGIAETEPDSLRTEQKQRQVRISPLQWIKRLARRLGALAAGKAYEAVEEEPLLLAGKWRKLKRLGFGSFAEVFLVAQQGEESMAVAKIPHTPKLNTKFLREAAILKQLVGHPNTVQLKEVVKEGGKVVLVQEYVEGHTLHESLAEGMSTAAKEKAYLELLNVVAYAHEKNIMHRDIKPENIIITPTGHLKLLDFGTSKDLSRASVSSTVIGSRPYMAPEQIMGKSRIASDVWALGIILYSLATEFLPFYDENEKQLMDLILESEPERPRELETDLPEELEVVILKCLQKDWSQRYSTAGELRKDLLKKLPDFGTGKVLPRY